MVYNFSGMLSHDARLRCDLVDLYYKLYGIKRPTCLPIPELVDILKPYKCEESKKKTQPSQTRSDVKKSPPIKKEAAEEIVLEDMEIKVKCFPFNYQQCLKLRGSFN